MANGEPPLASDYPPRMKPKWRKKAGKGFGIFIVSLVVFALALGALLAVIPRWPF